MFIKSYTKIKRCFKYLLQRRGLPSINYPFLKDLILQETPVYYVFDTKTKSNEVMELEKIRENLQKNLFAFTTIISFELSNICNYSIFHKKCPAYSQKEKVVLPLKSIFKALEHMTDYNKTIQFSCYNEPLIDPRLFFLINYTKTKVPNCEILLQTNGYYLNQTIADELIDVGVDFISCTAYTKGERSRLKTIKISKPFIINRANLDNRLKMYNNEDEGKYLNIPCNAPYNALTIRCNGNVGLCCYDSKNCYTFGNIINSDLPEILLSEQMIKTYYDLMNGIRNRNFCKNCGYSSME